jgi:hypothetical protein
MNIKPISGGVKPSLIETLDNIAESYNANYMESVKALNQATLDHSPILINEFGNDRDYWQWEYGKIDMIRNIIRDYPEIDGASYRVIAETENETVSEAVQ